jgi:Holliday junction resolvase RusA-like endonuclease
MLKDVMTELGYWNDDAQVCYETSSKIVSCNPELYIEVKELKPYTEEF